MDNVERAELPLKSAVSLREHACPPDLLRSFLHDLNNHFQVISGYAQLLTLGDIGEDSRRHLERIETEVERCQGLTQGVAYFAGRFGNRSQAMRIDEVLGSLERLILAHARRHQIELRSEHAPDLPVQEFVPRDLFFLAYQLFSNALSNVLRRESDRMIWLSSRATGDGVEIRVEDNGPGLAGNPARLFEPMYSGFEGEEHLGLGLTICRDLVEKYQGELYLDEIDNGVRATVRLPIALPERVFDM
ncbi:MAG: HAMP domain-containing sensor histidine kinase [Planctomycetota bacterium]